MTSILEPIGRCFSRISLCAAFAFLAYCSNGNAIIYSLDIVNSFAANTSIGYSLTPATVDLASGVTDFSASLLNIAWGSITFNFAEVGQIEVNKSYTLIIKLLPISVNNLTIDLYKIDQILTKRLTVSGGSSPCMNTSIACYHDILFRYNPQVQVPEPATLATLTALTSLALLRKRFKKSKD